MDDQASPVEKSTTGKRVIWVGLGLLLLLGVGFTGHYHATRNKRSHEKGELNGEGLYSRYCMRCHKADARGLPDKYPDLVESKLSEDEFLARIKTGKAKMPAFGDWFPEDYGLLQTYLQGLKK